jgi:hypothetical protein
MALHRHLVDPVRRQPPEAPARHPGQEGERAISRRWGSHRSLTRGKATIITDAPTASRPGSSMCQCCTGR